MKITKNQLNKILAELEGYLATVKEELAYLSETYQGQTSDELTNYWNGLHDLSRNLEGQMEDAFKSYLRRNWTSQDYQFSELVALNID